MLSCQMWTKISEECPPCIHALLNTCHEDQTNTRLQTNTSKVYPIHKVAGECTYIEQREKDEIRYKAFVSPVSVRVQMGYISSVCSGGQSCAVLADQKVMGFISAIHELASRERQFYCWLSSVRKLLLTPLRNRGERVSVPAPALLTFAVVYLLCIFTFDPLTIGGFKYVSLQCKLCAKPN